MFVKFNFWGLNGGVLTVKHDLNTSHFTAFGVARYSTIGARVFLSKGRFDNQTPVIIKCLVPAANHQLAQIFIPVYFDWLKPFDRHAQIEWFPVSH